MSDTPSNTETTVDVYNQDGLTSWHNHDFMNNPRFIKAYERGIRAVGADYNWHWRVHVGLWAAESCLTLPGDYVECGVNKGFLSSSIMDYLDWNTVDKVFYLLDTFKGIDEKHLTPLELEAGALEKNQKLIDCDFYTLDKQPVIDNFKQWSNIKIIAGSIPETLSQITSESIAFLHIDLNCALPEVMSVQHLFPRLQRGGIMLLDDYAYCGFHLQKRALDELAIAMGFKILSLPTGQGLVVK